MGLTFIGKREFRTVCGLLVLVLVLSMLGCCAAYEDHLTEEYCGIAREVDPLDPGRVLRPPFAGGVDEDAVTELGKCPGPGLAELHRYGITGEGVSIAIIGEPLYTGHEEYAESLAVYEEIHVKAGAPGTDRASWAVSAAVGKTCGVAPGASLYYIAVDQRKDRTDQYAKALQRLLEINSQLSETGKLRAIAFCAEISLEARTEEFLAAVEQARDEGIFVISPGQEATRPDPAIRRFGDVCAAAATRSDPLADPDDPESYTPTVMSWSQNTVLANGEEVYLHTLFLPTAARTFASADGGYAYFQSGAGRLEPAYLAGLFALAVQTKASIKPYHFYDVLLEETAVLLSRDLTWDRVTAPGVCYLVDAEAMVSRLWQEQFGRNADWRKNAKTLGIGE